MLKTKVGYTEKGKRHINTTELPLTEFEILLQAVRNTENGQTTIYTKNPYMERKMCAIFFVTKDGRIKYTWDSEIHNFRDKQTPHPLLLLKLRFYLFFGI